MADPQFAPQIDGQEIDLSDYQLLGEISGLAGDRLLAELLRLTPFDGTNTARTILPYGVLPKEGASATNQATVQSTGSANGSINVNPFRAVVGSRTAVGTSPTENWQDIRSGLFIGPAALAQTIALTANSSGNPRWDLVYATIAIDQAGGTGTRRVKNPTTGAVTSNAVTTVLNCPVTVPAPVIGIPAGTPTLPSLPADTPGVSYNIALAYVYVPNGFGATTTVSSANIRDAVPTTAGLSPTTGTLRCMPASGNNDQAGTYQADTSGPGLWMGGIRPGLFLPPGLSGMESRLIQIDLSTSGHPSHANGAVVDDTIDWRHRFFIVYGSYGDLRLPTIAIGGDSGDIIMSGFILTPSTPFINIGPTSGNFICYSQSMWNNTLISGANSPVVSIEPTGAPPNYIMYVDQSTGVLRWNVTGGAPAALSFWFWVFASGPFPNF